MYLKWVVATIAAMAMSTGQQRNGGFIQPDPIDFSDHAGWQSMFDGTTLKGWEGGEPRNFELKVEIKLEGSNANSGIQYRSSRVGADQVI